MSSLKYFPPSLSLNPDNSSPSLPFSKAIQLNTPLDNLQSLQQGTIVLLSGKLYTARDAAHKRLIETLNQGKSLPVNLQGQVLYYTGPTPASNNRVIGSAGPTSSYRMDPFTPMLLECGLKGAIGKGERSLETMEAFRQFGALYFLAVGGTGALIAQCIKSASIVAYADLGAEAIYELVVEDMRLIVA